MSRGRQQKWICLDCKSEFSVQGITPKICCSCGSRNIGRAPSLELVKNFTEKRRALEEICKKLNPVYQEYVALKEERDTLMAYWKQQRRRGYISAEEYNAMDELFEGEKRHKGEKEMP